MATFFWMNIVDESGRFFAVLFYFFYLLPRSLKCP